MSTSRELCICKWRLHACKVVSLEGADVHPRRERGTYRQASAKIPEALIRYRYYLGIFSGIARIDSIDTKIDSYP